MASGETEDASSRSPLKPLLRWAEPIFSSAYERTLRQWTAAAQCQPDCLDIERLQPSLHAAFAGPALFLSARTLLLELAIARHQRSLQGETPEQRFQSFLDWIDSAVGRDAIDARFPLLHTDIARQATQTERFLGQFLQRIAHDFPQLAWLLQGAQQPGRLTAFDMGQGDRHDHGGSVVKLTFESGRALYKPRSLAMDVVFARFIASLAEHGVMPVQKATTTLDCGEYGYAGWIDHAPLKDEAAAGRYYRRYGGLVAIAYALNCTDLHLENLIACGEYPVLIDLETVLQPWIKRRAKDDREAIPYTPSILSSGLLPGQLSVDAWDISGLAWAEHRYKTRMAAGAGTDELRLEPTDAVIQPGANVPRLADGRRIASHGYLDEIVDGFESTYRGLLRLKPKLRSEDGLLAPFAGLETRTVLRSTQIYARLLDAISHPQYLRSTGDREAVLAKLALGGREWAFLRRCQAVEREAMLRGDVPRFMARVDGIDIHDGDGHVVDGLCDLSGMAEAQRRLRGMSLRDLRRQRYALAQALECDRLSSAVDDLKSTPHPGQRIASAFRPYRGGSFLETAIALGDDLLQLSFHDRHGMLFFQPECRDTEQSSMSMMDAALYEGLPGVALLFAELGLHSGLTRFTRAADAALVSCRRMLRDDPQALSSIGAYSGLSGWLYVLLTLGVRWQRDELIDEAVSWLPRLVECIGDDREFDLIDGAASCLLVLLELQRYRPGDDVLIAASACAVRLVDNARRDADGAHWVGAASEDGNGLSGFAHGTAGIGAALMRYGQQVQDAACLALAAEALRYERVAFVARGRRWCDRNEKVPSHDGGLADPCSWCHGAPGVGLARLLWPETLRDATWRDEVMHCMATTREHGMTEGHSLCHGQFGNLELLLQYAVQERDAVVLADGRRLGQAVLESARSGWLCGGSSVAQEPLGLMIGVAGIAYGCLRLADPVATPSVLSLAVGTPTWSPH